MDNNEKKSKTTVKEYIDELEKVLSDPEKLTYEETKQYMDVAYEAISLNSAEDNEENAIILKSIMDRLSVISTLKKPKPNNKVIPKPVFDNKESKKEEEIPVAKTAVSVTEPSKEEIDKAISAQNEAKQNVTYNQTLVINESNKNEVSNDTIDTDNVVNESNKNEVSNDTIDTDNVVNDKMKEEENETVSMEIDDPSIEEQIFVSNDDDVDNKETSSPKDIYEYYGVEKTNEPFEGDDDLDVDVEGDSDLANAEFDEKQDKNEERIKRIEKDFSTAPDGMQMLNIKSISRKKMSDTLKALSKINTEGLNIDKINMFDFNESDDNIRREYLKSRNDMVASPKVARIALIMSGHYEEISAYGNFDLISMQRNISNPDKDFVDKELLIYNSIYDHVKFVSYASEKPSFEEWAKHIYYPDISSLFYGVYDANSVGENSYTFRCPFCGAISSASKKNKDLAVAVPEEITKDSLESFITSKDLIKKDFTDIAKWARTAVVRKQLNLSKIIVDYSVPTLYDYLVVLNTARRISQRDLNGSLDLSSIELFNSDGNEEDAMRILAYMYIKSIGVPSKVENSNKFRYIKLTEKADIIEYVNSLDLEDYSELFTGNKVQDIFTKTATRYFIENVTCENEKCKRNIKYIAIDPKQIFFFKIGEVRS